MTKFINFIKAVPNPDEWPCWLRRTFILTLPVSGPLYIAVLALWIAMLAVFMSGLVLWLWAEYLWLGPAEK